MLLREMFTRVAIATDNAGQGPIVTARDELRHYRATFFGHETRHFARYCHSCPGFCTRTNTKWDNFSSGRCQQRRLWPQNRRLQRAIKGPAVTPCSRNHILTACDDEHAIRRFPPLSLPSRLLTLPVPLDPTRPPPLPPQ